MLFRRCPWGAIDSAFEKRIPYDAPCEHADALRRQVESGSAELYHIEQGGKTVGMVVARVDCKAEKEFVVIAAFADSEQPVSSELDAWATALAASSGCASIRFHTIRAAAARFAVEVLGYRLTELVLRKNVLR